jgi:hypothetical protein
MEGSKDFLLPFHAWNASERSTTSSHVRITKSTMESITENEFTVCQDFLTFHYRFVRFYMFQRTRRSSLDKLDSGRDRNYVVVIRTVFGNDIPSTVPSKLNVLCTGR